ncbi:hypothetical protein [uncultured Brevundimonas sp.]|uniref:hypothetical protein n=1 Tax=uncultured Brevundimonas sp. TaxID=213418 RepID=UPI0030EBA67C|tara:strand:- start:1817 stop:2167 length:351 start_codon:yes stop_codon:yes gene_type:complete
MSALILMSLMLSVQSPASASDLQAAFSNTLVSTYPDGRTARLWLAEGGRFEGQDRRGGRNSGVWRVRDGKLCLSQRRPLPMPGQFCTPIVRVAVGGSWTARAMTGETIRVTLVAGR